MKSFIGSTTPYILAGFDVINPNSAIGTQNISLKVADSIVYYPGSQAGPFFHGLPAGNIQAAPLIPELRKNSTNYVYLTLTTTNAAKDTRAFWDPDKEGGIGGEFTQDVDTQSVLSAAVNVSVSAFPDNTVPLCKVVVGSNFIISIEDARDMMFRLGTGGLNPNPLAKYQFRNEPSVAYSRAEPNTLMSNALDPNSFKGGDKNIQSLKEWMDVVMTKLLELGGTTYWYEDASSFNAVNIFKDALSTSIRSKGTWSSSSISQGQITWSEDIQLQQVADYRNIIIRAGNKTLSNDQVMYIKNVKDAVINTGAISVDWFNGINYVNGTLGSFENLSKGDWIKKSDDVDSLYLRVEEFYVAVNNGGGVTSPGNALSVKLSGQYTGLSELKQGVYTKGIYLTSDVFVNNRNHSDLESAGGNLYWLAMRSDTNMSISNIVTTTVTADITGHDGVTALCTSVGHGLSDGMSLTFAGTTNFNGTYKIIVNDANTFTITVPGAVVADELAQSAYYATVTTTTTSTINGLQLESAAHGFETGQRIFITNTTNYNASYDIFVVNNSSFTVPVSSVVANETVGNATLTAIMVRTDIGPSRLVPGSIKVIGEADTQNIQSFIGMSSLTQTSPVWNVTPAYNTINGQVNYNASDIDSLMERGSKLTAMMANKAQDKTIKFNANFDTVVNTTNVLNQDITFTSTGTATLDIELPGSTGSYSIGLGGTLSLAANQVAYFTINRNNIGSLANLTGLTIANINSVPLNENIFIFAVRLGNNNIWLWNESEAIVGSTPSPTYLVKIVKENNLVKFNANFDTVVNTTNVLNQDITFTSTGTATLDIILPNATGSYSIGLGGTLSLAANQVAYFTINRNAAGSLADLTGLTIANINSVPLNENIFIFATRLNNNNIWLWDESEINVGIIPSSAYLAKIVKENNNIAINWGAITWNGTNITIGSSTISIPGSTLGASDIVINALASTALADNECLFLDISRSVATALTFSAASPLSTIITQDRMIMIRRLGVDLIIR